MSSAVELDQVEELISKKWIVTSSIYSNSLDQLILKKANDLDWSTTTQTGDSHDKQGGPSEYSFFFLWGWI